MKIDRVPEYRANGIAYHNLKAEYRALSEDKRQFDAIVMAYGPVDDYGTVWSPGTFTDYMGTRMPRIAWAHDWTDPLGRYVDVDDDGQRMRLRGEFDPFDAVPQAYRAWTQLGTGTIDQFSVGFVRREWDKADELSESDRAAGAVERMHKADLPEVSPVLVGAVPGTELIGVRSVRMANGQTVPGDFVIDLGRKLDKGEITASEAQKALALVAGTPIETDDDSEVLEEADQILEELGL